MYLIFIEEHPQLFDADTQVSLVELVRNVPSQWSKIPPLLNKSVEETQAKKQALPFMLQQQQHRNMKTDLQQHKCYYTWIYKKYKFWSTHWFLAISEELGIRYWIIDVGSYDICPHPLGRLVGHLDAILKHWDGKMWRGVGGQPHPEVRVCAIWIELFTDLLKSGHPRNC